MTESTAKTGSTSHAGLQMRDLIYIGVYTVLYFVLIGIGAAFVHALPFGLPFMGLVCGVLGGTPYMLVLTKSRRFGAITIMGVLLAALMGGMHGNYYTVATAVAASLCADVIARAGNYRNFTFAWVSAGVFNLWNIGLFLPFFIGRDDYLSSLAARSGSDYAARLAGLFPGWMLPALVPLGLLGGMAGALMAKALIRKHLDRAGLV